MENPFTIYHSPLTNALAFRELEALARALLPVLLALLGAGVARHQPGALERGAQVGVELHERARDAVAHRAGLARRASARDVDDDVELAGGVCERQRLADDHAQGLVGEVVLEGLAVDLELARARPEVDARGGSLAPPRSVILYVCHSSSSLTSVMPSAPPHECSRGAARGAAPRVGASPRRRRK